MRPEVMIEFGARSTGEPHRPASVGCDAAAHLTDLAFPRARPNTMLPVRTFWGEGNCRACVLSPAATPRGTHVEALARSRAA